MSPHTAVASLTLLPLLQQHHLFTLPPSTAWLIVGSLTPSDSFSRSRDADPGGCQQQEVARQQQQLGHALLQTRRIRVGSRQWQWQWSFESVGREVVE
eukprot:scaffold93709_cov54-Cyclotella_meneghiniana.AAC.1